MKKKGRSEEVFHFSSAFLRRYVRLEQAKGAFSFVAGSQEWFGFAGVHRSFVVCWRLKRVGRLPQEKARSLWRKFFGCLMAASTPMSRPAAAQKTRWVGAGVERGVIERGGGWMLCEVVTKEVTLTNFG